ncbi:Glucose-repressible alcohol dehydrogenase transcriptional effector [Marasmius crinis-equi]|uniref:Glucose-repressible alcohol dehydrogenase transcriptional effector n=1 Tax=Marasmius crinis-equi TaxID=585013 RepID=A0ABR3G2L1_9AGAR
MDPPPPTPSSFPVAPPPRQIIRRAGASPKSEQDETFSVLCYNILCPQYASPSLYHYTPAWALPWEYRRMRIMDEIRRYSCDLVCLQEVDWDIYDEWLREEMEREKYSCFFCPSWAKKLQRSRRDGVAVFWRADRFRLLQHHIVEFSSLAEQREDFRSSKDVPNRFLQRGNVGIICLLRSLTTGKPLLLVNTHLYWDPEFCDVKLVQAGLLGEEIEKVAQRVREEQATSEVPVVLCGDFNSMPNSGVYEFLSTGSVSRQHPDFKRRHYGLFTKTGLNHGLELRSAYAHNGGSPPDEGGPGTSLKIVDTELLPWTNYTAHFRGVLDYIWYSKEFLHANTYLGGIDQEYLEAEKVIGFPDAHFPSDHIPIMTEFTWRASMKANM